MTPSSEEIAAALEVLIADARRRHSSGGTAPPGQCKVCDYIAVLTAHLSRLREEARVLAAAKVWAGWRDGYGGFCVSKEEDELYEAARALEEPRDG